MYWHGWWEQDLEAQKPSEPVLDAAVVADVAMQKPPAEFAHAGRGGAGNYYSPKALSETGKFTESGEAGVGAANSGTPPQRVGYGGRGGVGNYMAKDNEEEERLREIEAKKKDMVA